MSVSLAKKILSHTGVRYLITGGASYGIELSVLLLLSGILHLGPVLSVGISFWVGLVISFILQKFLAFNNKTVKPKHLIRQSLQYGALVLVNYLFTLWFVSTFEPIVGLVIARTVALIITTIWNYFIYKYVLFGNKKVGIYYIIGQMSATQKKRKLLYALSGIFGLFLVAYIALGVFSRPMADDLIFLNGYGVSDVVSNFHYAYTVNGRLTTLTIYVVGFIIPIISQLTALLTISVLGVGIYMLSKQFLRLKTPTNLLQPVTLCSTLAILSAFAILTPSPPSSIFWFSAAVVHIWSYGFILMLSAQLLKLRERAQVKIAKKELLFYFFLTALVGLFGEMPALTIILLHMLILLVDSLRKNHKHTMLTLSGLAAGFTAFAWLYFAPASVSRRANVEAEGGLSTIDFLKHLPQELHENISTQFPHLFQNISLLVIVFFGATLLGLYFTKRKQIEKHILTLLLIIAAIFASFYIINFCITYLAGGYIPLRIYAASSLGFIVSSYLFGYLFGHTLRRCREITKGIALGSLCTLSLLILISSAAFIPWGVNLAKELRGHANAWDSRDLYIKEQIKQGTCSIKTVSLPIGDVGDISKDPDYWINKEGIENYYRPPSNQDYWKKCSVIST